VKTEIISEEEDEYSIGAKDQGQFVFSCEAESDDSTPISIRWYKVEAENEFIQVHNVSEKIVLGRDGSLMIRLAANDSEGWSVHGGTYQCIATNGYSSAERTVRIIVVPVEPVVPGLVNSVILYD